MFCQSILERIEQKYQKTRLLLRDQKPEVAERIEQMPTQQQWLLKFYYGYMPLNDLLEYDLDLFLAYAEHNQMLWQQFRQAHAATDKEWESIFLNYIAFYRIKNENLIFDRKFFYDQLHHQIQGLSDYEAVKQINYWCSQYVTYQSTDERTMAPLTTYRTGYGRCGEESGFVVTVYRSLGFAARQVYVPWWSHCDDNHAWVEVLIDGEWYYLGACEPEPQLNRGWFRHAAKRAMMIRTQLFTDLFDRQQVVETDGGVTFISVLENYVKTHRITIQVVDRQGRPVKDCWVHFQVVNFSSYRDIAKRQTDEDGIVKMNVGIGSLNIMLAGNGVIGNYLIKTDQLNHRLELVDNRTDAWLDKNWTAPVDDYLPQVSDKSESDQTPSIAPQANRPDLEKQKRAALRKARAAEQEAQNQQYYQTYLRRTLQTEQSEHMQNIINKYPVESLFRQAGANGAALNQFLYHRSGLWRTELKLRLLMSLAAKDLLDFRASDLISHLEYIEQFEEQYPTAVFDKGLLAIRIAQEQLSDYLSQLDQLLTTEEKQYFRQQPDRIWQRLSAFRTEISSNQLYRGLWLPPAICWKHQLGSEQDQRLLCVAIARSLGVPSYLAPEDGQIMIYRQGQFVRLTSTVETGSLVRLDWSADAKSKPIYFTNYTIARQGEEGYQILDLERCQTDAEGIDLLLSNGQYRIVLSTRLPNGNLYLRERTFHNQAQPLRLEMELRTYDVAEMLINIRLEPFYVRDQANHLISSEALLSSDKTILVWLDNASEPSQHILNELNAARSLLNRQAVPIVLISNVEPEQNLLLSRVAAKLASARIYYDQNNYNLNQLARRTYVPVETYPLILVVKRDQTAIFASAGYNVGVVDTAFSCAK